MDDKKTMHHMCVDVSGFRRNCEHIRGHWKNILDKNTGQPFKTKAKAIAAIDELISKGIRVIPLSECDNFDFQKGCQGHRIIEVGDRHPSQGLGLDWSDSGNGVCDA
jgi:thiamine biosynthesis lipoprotein ApbE